MNNINIKVVDGGFIVNASENEHTQHYEFILTDEKELLHWLESKLVNNKEE